jgi:hypothetical protein
MLEQWEIAYQAHLMFRELDILYEEAIQDVLHGVPGAQERAVALSPQLIDSWSRFRKVMPVDATPDI